MRLTASVALALFAGILAAPSVLAIPIQQAGTATDALSAASAGPKRPGPIPQSSATQGISNSGGEVGGPHRPVPASINLTLQAEK